MNNIKVSGYLIRCSVFCGQQSAILSILESIINDEYVCYTGTFVFTDNKHKRVSVGAVGKYITISFIELEKVNEVKSIVVHKKAPFVLPEGIAVEKSILG